MGAPGGYGCPRWVLVPHVTHGKCIPKVNTDALNLLVLARGLNRDVEFRGVMAGCSPW